MGADAKLQPTPLDSREIRRIQIFLPQMDVGNALIQRDLPVIIEHKAYAQILGNGSGGADFSQQFGLGPVLDAKLDKACACLPQPLDPLRGIDNG